MTRVREARVRLEAYSKLKDTFCEVPEADMSKKQSHLPLSCSITFGPLANEKDGVLKYLPYLNPFILLSYFLALPLFFFFLSSLTFLLIYVSVCVCIYLCIIYTHTHTNMYKIAWPHIIKGLEVYTFFMNWHLTFLLRVKGFPDVANCLKSQGNNQQSTYKEQVNTFWLKWFCLCVMQVMTRISWH